MIIWNWKYYELIIYLVKDDNSPNYLLWIMNLFLMNLVLMCFELVVLLLAILFLDWLFLYRCYLFPFSFFAWARQCNTRFFLLCLSGCCIARCCYRFQGFSMLELKVVTFYLWRPFGGVLGFSACGLWTCFWLFVAFCFELFIASFS